MKSWIAYRWLIQTSLFNNALSRRGGCQITCCYTENLRDDLIFFLSQKSEYPIGVDSGVQSWTLFRDGVSI